jgi:two-component system NtrC family response regulator
VGKDREQKSNFRLVAATNRDLWSMVEQGLFRSDLYFRLNTFNIHLPPLRDREQDIEKLVMGFVFAICRRNHLSIKGVVPETLETLAAYHWPGNVRELKNTLEKAIIADPGNPVLYPIHLPPEIRLCRIRTMVSQKYEQTPASCGPASEAGPEQIVFPQTLPPFKEYRRQLTADIEKHYLQRLLQETAGDIAKACGVSGLSRSRLYDLLKAHGLGCAADPRPE